MDRKDIVRSAYERFNAKDFAGALEFFHPGAEHADLLRIGVIVKGKEAILQLWTERFAEAGVSAILGDMLEIGDSVVVAVCYQPYTPSGATAGSSMIVAHRFVLQGNRIARIEATVLEDLPENARALFLHPR